MIIPISGDTLGLIACKDDLVPVAELAKVNILFYKNKTILYSTLLTADLSDTPFSFTLSILK